MKIMTLFVETQRKRHTSAGSREVAVLSSERLDGGAYSMAVGRGPQAARRPAPADRGAD